MVRTEIVLVLLFPVKEYPWAAVMQMSLLRVWSTAFSDDERSETEYRLSADETSLTLSGSPPENRDNSRDNIRTKHFIIAKIHIFTQLSKRNQHRNRSGTFNLFAP